jgi:uncharacterized protein (DUF58 family)
MTDHKDLFDSRFLARIEHLRLISKRLAARGPAARRRGLRLGDGLEFADHRDYARGDDTRYIDWPYYGRMEKLLLRMFHEHSEGVVTILLDASSSMRLGDRKGKFHYAIRASAALAYVAMGGLERVRIAPFADRLGEAFFTGRNRGQIVQVLDFLAGCRAEGTTRLAAATTELVSRSVRPGDMVFLISDLLGCEDELDEAMARLRLAGATAVVIHVIDSADAQPPAAGAIDLEDIESHLVRSISLTSDGADRYRQSWEAFLEGCRRMCMARGGVYLAAETQHPLDRLILHALRQAGVAQ